MGVGHPTVSFGPASGATRDDVDVVRAEPHPFAAQPAERRAENGASRLRTQ